MKTIQPIRLKLSKETVRILTTKTGIKAGGSVSGCRGGVCATIGGADCGGPRPSRMPI